MKASISAIKSRKAKMWEGSFKKHRGRPYYAWLGELNEGNPEGFGGSITANVTPEDQLLYISDIFLSHFFVSMFLQNQLAEIKSNSFKLNVRKNKAKQNPVFLEFSNAIIRLRVLLPVKTKYI